MVKTFLPYPNIKKSIECLDDRRCGKQRVEAYQIIRALRERTAWYKHPACKMWIGYENLLIQYYNACIDEWVKRGKKNNMIKIEINGEIIYPWWFGWDHFHMSHQSSLIRKHPAFYGPKFNTEKYYLDKGYVWPSHHNEDALSKTKVDYLFAKVNPDTSKSAHKSKELLYTCVELKKLAKEKNIKKYYKMRKRDLLLSFGLIYRIIHPLLIFSGYLM